MMAANSIVVQKPPSTYMCSFSLYTSTVVMAMFQTILSALLAVLYKVKIEGDSVIVRILFWIHVCCSVSALLFSLFCLAKRKIGSTYEVVLHGYLLSVLEPRSNRSTIMNAIYTVVLVASTLAYSAVAWIGLSMDANANEDLF
ncbi:hypothetical protein B9Z55_017023 [Caenorhabditis nigoni]|uniref:Uncharacterized protein n=1 Tax=Caenorhabditis nigoni TaxID=1611254 RepID=A0A2G5T7M4_9PELO|nr:hypothetical protein B9Z55_017023 [Caenorhabditis nigoni]